MKKNHYLKNLGLNIFVSIVSLAITFIMLEAALRVLKQEYGFKNFVVEETSRYKGYSKESNLRCCPTKYDPSFGWTPKERYFQTDEILNQTISTIEYGIRSNGNDMLLSSSSRLILAVGDSFTWGYNVSDNETWPAILEKKLGEKVLNAGVFGYGIDQMYLRAKKLIKVFNPKIVILSFIAADVGRVEHSISSGAGKPYFKIIGNKLVKKNVPVPEPSDRDQLDPFRKIAGYSYLFHKLMMKNNMGFWLGWSELKRPQSEGEKTSCMLISRLNEFARENGVEDIFILIQYMTFEKEELETIDRVTNCLKNIPVKVVDIRPALYSVKNRDLSSFERLFKLKGKGHPTYEGYTLAADQIYKAIKDDQ